MIVVASYHDGRGGRPNARKLAIRVNVDLASLPGPPGFLSGPWVLVVILLPGLTVLVF